MASRLKSDVEALMEFTSFDVPPKIPIRPSNVAAIYLVGDASGYGEIRARDAVYSVSPNDCCLPHQCLIRRPLTMQFLLHMNF